MPEFAWRNTVTSSRTLVKPHKGLKWTEGFARSCFRKKQIWKIPQKIHPKETIMKSFLQLPHNLQLHWKRTPWQLFSNDFWKKFLEYCFVSDTGNGTEETEVFARICFRKKLIWKISQNSTKRNCDEVLSYRYWSVYWKSLILSWPFGNLDKGNSASALALQKLNRTFMSNTPKYSSLCLVISANLLVLRLESFIWSWNRMFKKDFSYLWEWPGTTV